MIYIEKQNTTSMLEHAGFMLGKVCNSVDTF